MASSGPPGDDPMDAQNRGPPLGAGEGVKDILCRRNFNFPPFFPFLMQYCTIIHKNNPQTKPDLMVMFPYLQLHPDQRQSRQSLGGPNPRICLYSPYGLVALALIIGSRSEQECPRRSQFLRVTKKVKSVAIR